MIKQFTWRGGVNYLFDNGVTPYFSYSESFEPIASQVVEAIRDISCKPSKGKQYEARREICSGMIRPVVVTGAVYNLTKTNNLMADPDGFLYRKLQRGEIRARGVEIEAKAALNRRVLT